MKKTYLFITTTIIISLMTIYIGASVTINQERIIKLQAELDTYEYYQYEEKKQTIETKIKNLETQLYQATLDKEIAVEAADPLGILRAEAIINSCKEEIEQANITLTQNNLQQDLNNHYIENKEKIIDTKYALIEYDNHILLSKYYLYPTKEEYLEAIKTEMKAKSEAEQLKNDLGYSTQTILQEANSNLKIAKLETEIATKEQNNLKQQLDIKEISTKKKQDPKIKDLEDNYLKTFISNSIQLKNYNQQLSAYENYINNTTTTSVELEKAKLQLELLESKIKQYKIDLEIYINNLITNHEILIAKIEITQNKLSTLENKQKDNELLLSQEKITEIKLLEIKTELAKTKLEQAELITQANQIHYILENNIEN